MVTQKEIAEKLGISRTTVARALNSNGSIDSERKEEIIKLATELGYEKNIIGSTLARKSDKIIYAFIVKSINTMYTETMKNTLLILKEEYKLYGVKLKIIETLISEPEEQLKDLKKVMGGKVDGILVVPLLKKEINELIKENPNIKFVTCDISISKDVYYAGPDYFKSGRVAADVLINLLNDNDKVLLLDTKEDNVSSKEYHKGFFERIQESTLKIVGPIYSENLLNNIPDILDKYYTEEIKSVYSSRYIEKIVDYIYESPEKFGKMKIVAGGLSERRKNQLLEGKINALIIEKTAKGVEEAFKMAFNLVAKNQEPQCKHIVLKPRIIFKENCYDL